jgi:hypothetical protein
MANKLRKNRKVVHVLNDAHKRITDYAIANRMSIKNATDEILESGFRVKRIPAVGQTADTK